MIEPQPYRYVPSRVSEVIDLLGSMVLHMPDIPMPVTGDGIDEAYGLLHESLEVVRKRIGDDRFNRLMEMAQQSKQLFIDGSDREGRAVLTDMIEVISGREPKSQ